MNALVMRSEARARFILTAMLLDAWIAKDARGPYALPLMRSADHVSRVRSLYGVPPLWPAVLS